MGKESAKILAALAQRAEKTSPPPPSSAKKSATAERKEELYNENLEQDLRLKEQFFKNATKLLKFWLMFVAFFVLASSLKIWGGSDNWTSFLNYFSITASENVIIALLTNSTFYVIGIYMVIARYLYPSSKS